MSDGIEAIDNLPNAPETACRLLGWVCTNSGRLDLIERIDSGPRLSKAIVANGTVYLSGLTAKAKTPCLIEQTKDVLEQIEQLLEKTGSSKSHLLSVQIWLADIRQFEVMNAVWEKWIGSDEPPSRATVEARLVGDALVEMKAVALR